MLPFRVSCVALQTEGRFDPAKYQRLLASPQARQGGILVALENYYRTEIPKEKLFELVTLRLNARLPVQRHDFSGVSATPRDGNAVPIATRKVFFDDAFVDCPVYERNALRPGDTPSGPAIVEQMDATTVIPPDFHLRVDDGLNLMLLLST